MLPLACSAGVPILKGILSQQISRKESQYLEKKAVSIPMPASMAHFIPNGQIQLHRRNRQLPIPLLIPLPQLTFLMISLRSGDTLLTLPSPLAADRTYRLAIIWRAQIRVLSIQKAALRKLSRISAAASTEIMIYNLYPTSLLCRLLPCGMTVWVSWNELNMRFGARRDREKPHL